MVSIWLLNAQPHNPVSKGFIHEANREYSSASRGKATADRRGIYHSKADGDAAFQYIRVLGKVSQARCEVYEP